MLTNLHVKNLALIDETEVDFTEGFNILTGETGAGKSILIDSINIALGQKNPKDMIRSGEEQALVELTFHIEEELTLKKLHTYDIPIDDNTIIISRRIRSGRSITKVNGESVTTTDLRNIAGLLIDIHGQHEHQSLLYKSKHLDILDQFLKEEAAPLMPQLKEAYNSYDACYKKLSSARIPEEERVRELSFLQYERNEIESANLKTGEEEELDLLYKKLSNAETILQELDIVYQMTGGEDSAIERIGRALRQLTHVIGLDESFGGLEEELCNIEDLLNDVNREIKEYLSELDFEPALHQQIEDRLKLIHTLKSKYGTSIDEIGTYYNKILEKIQMFEDYDLYIEELKEEEKKTKQRLEEDCKKLSALRKEKAVILENKIREALLELNFLEVRFQIYFEKTNIYTAKGYDDVEFLISTNPGEELKPLGRVVSGGELSRIMLAIKSVLADKDAVDTLIFDEIDTGISGRTAQKVSERLAVMSKTHQVISITHLPQIASMADEHFMIEKETKNGRTRTNVYALGPDESVAELARMLGGAKITDAVQASAKEMKELADKTKQSWI